MTRRPSLQGPIAVLILMGFGASFVGIAAPRGASEPSAVGTSAGVTRSLRGAPEQNPARWSGSPDATTGGTTGVPPSPTPRPIRSTRSSNRVEPTASPRPPSSGRVASGTRPQVARKAAQPTQTSTESPRPAQSGAAAAELERGLSGQASWYCLSGRSACTRGYGPDCLCAAAGPAVRAALGDWRGRLVTVSTSRASVTVRLVDFCSCPGGRVLDLYASVMGGLGVPLSAGVVDVEVSW